jgi:hypothetical protein
MQLIEELHSDRRMPPTNRCHFYILHKLGWSGGGSLSTLYQAEAEKMTITHTPAGLYANHSLKKIRPRALILNCLCS